MEGALQGSRGETADLRVGKVVPLVAVDGEAQLALLVSRAALADQLSATCCFA